MDLFFFIGVVGILLILLAFLIENIGKSGKNKIYYNILNCIGSFFLLLYAYANNTILFIFLNAVWVLIAIYFIVRHYIFK
jgi:hypothetical protein